MFLYSHPANIQARLLQCVLHEAAFENFMTTTIDFEYDSGAAD